MREGAEARRERKPREEVGVGGHGFNPTICRVPHRHTPSAPPSAGKEKMGASSSPMLPSPGLGGTIDSVCFRGLQEIGWESEEGAVQSSLSIIRGIKDRFHPPQPTSMCSMN